MSITNGKHKLSDEEIYLASFTMEVTLGGLSQDVFIKVVSDCTEEAGDLPWWAWVRRARLVSEARAAWRLALVTADYQKKQST